jgi:hypothetical protein
MKQVSWDAQYQSDSNDIYVEEALREGQIIMILVGKRDRIDKGGTYTNRARKHKREIDDLQPYSIVRYEECSGILGNRIP